MKRYRVCTLSIDGHVEVQLETDDRTEAFALKALLKPEYGTHVWIET